MTELDQLRVENKMMREALEDIATDYISEDKTGIDCPSCIFDGDIRRYPNHSPDCVYVIAKNALSQPLTTKLAEIERAKDAVIELALPFVCTLTIKHGKDAGHCSGHNLGAALARLAELERNE